MQTVYTVLIMLLVVGASRLFIRVIPLPLPVIQIALGVLLAWPTLGLHVSLDPELFLLLFIPPLLFSDGWRMPKREFWRLRGPILGLAFGLVFFTVLFAGYFIHWLIPTIPLAAAFALAAVLSPTDALAVSGIAQSRLPKSMMHTLQGEALMNDASGLVAFKFAITATLTGVFSLSAASLEFVWVASGGLAVGVLLSWLVGRFRSWLIRRGSDDPATHVVFLLLVPFASYVVAEHLGVSGILSAVAAGMMQSRVDLLPRQTTTRLLNQSVWEMLEFVFNGLVFLLLGLQMPDIVRAAASHADPLWPELSGLLLDVLLIFLVLIVLRATWILGVARLGRWFRRGAALQDPQVYTKRYRLLALMTFSGVRGAVTLAAVLSVPLVLADGSAFPERDRLIFIASGVILLSLLVACVGLPLLLRKLDWHDSGELHEQEVNEARRKTAEAAIHALEQDSAPAVPEEDAVQSVRRAELKAQLMAEYRAQLALFNDSREARAQTQQMLQVERTLRLQALRAQRLELYRQRRHNEIDDETVREILHDLDVSEAGLGHIS